MDLNATAVELAEISLWLDTMVSGLQAPWFGLRLRRGNSLIGARRAVYSRAQVNDKSWLKATPTDVPLTGMVEEMADGATARQTGGRIHHFLLPAERLGLGGRGQGSRSRPRARGSEPRSRSGAGRSPASPAASRSTLWSSWPIGSSRCGSSRCGGCRSPRQEARRNIPLWGREEQEHTQAVTREQIEATLNDPNGAYQRLRRVMDAWAALWFWPLTDTDGVTPPTLDSGSRRSRRCSAANPRPGKNAPGYDADLATARQLGRPERCRGTQPALPGPTTVTQVLKSHPWLRVCETVAEQQGFFHWELDFATVFARGGFDLQLGNPPWVRPRTDMDALLAEGDPWWQLALKPSEACPQG